MAPARTANRRGQRDQNVSSPNDQSTPPSDLSKELFMDPMMGTPLQIYVEKDVENRDTIVDLITSHGGLVSPGYSGVPYICVDPHKESGQSLYRQYAGKKGKMVLDAAWVLECVKAGVLQTYHNNWAGFKVTGKEQVIPIARAVTSQSQAGPSSSDAQPPLMTEGMSAQMHPPPPNPPQVLQQQAHTVPPPITAATTDPILHHHAQHPYPYAVYAPPMAEVTTGAIHPSTAAPPQSWQGSSGIPPQATHMPPPPPAPPHMMPHEAYRDEQAWSGAYHQPPPHPGAMVGAPPPPYDYRFREDQRAYFPAPDYYPQHYDQSYAEPEGTYMEEAGPSNAESSTQADPSDKRGRKRVRAQPQPAPPASSLVANRRNPPARSPTPPTRVIKSTYGGNLFTADDVEYLRKYIEYCQEQGLVLSLREICERVAVKAPHHTFYSWRRYCNKHQIRLGGYAMDAHDADEDLGSSESQSGQQPPGQAEPEPQVVTTAGPGAMEAARRAAAADINRTRSPTPPRALFRSTTGKGVAFTEEDITFLVRFLEYRNRTQGVKMDMVIFWKDVAAKAPHHSRASWMKFYRRHKHELNHNEGDAPLPAPPEKKMRYSRMDDVLLAKFFLHKPEGTSDKVFQQFGRLHPHHPWKGWQEHHRIHKSKIDHLIQRLANGENIDEGSEE
ncbi:uncharacterized protein FIBRA_02449 [Fibroporia radiculosa]|uniref:BRCT domain-containing protein n=1 Tax=Fibroporia radiculosa TaxID=599839 RepID=J4H1V2_9APHY|nr:uncharacterized protein FIBRA_02449 [Fibroporia radiculosa]CCM00419.1 predicted protein [Fibroporia radiculosa]